MGRMGVITYFGIVALLLCCETTKGQEQFTITESNEAVTVGNIAASIVAGGRHLRFEEESCREVFTVDDGGIINTTRGIDRESNFIQTNADEESRLSCVIAYHTDDGNNNTIRIEVTIADVNDNAPEFTTNLTVFSVKENTGPNHTIFLLTVKDADKGDNGTVDDVVMSGGERYFRLTKEEEPNGIERVLLVTSDQIIDFEMHQQFNLTFTATDRGTPQKTNTVVLTINVENDNEHPPVFSFTQYTFDVQNTEPIGTIIGSVSATDTDEGEFGVVLYRITRVTNSGSASCGNSNGLFTINATTGVLYLNQSAEGIRCTFTIRVEGYNDGGIGDGGIATIQVSVVKARLIVMHNREVIDHLNDTLEEGRPHSYVLNVEGGDDSDIQFNEIAPEPCTVHLLGDLVLMECDNIDREKTPFISGTLNVSSNDVQVEPAILSISFTVSDINDNAPVFEMTNFSVQENRPIGYEIGLVDAFDPDEGENATVNYTLLSSSEPEGLIMLHSNGSLVVNVTIDFEQVEKIELRVRAQDGGTPSMYQDGVIYIDIENVNDNSPVFSDQGFIQPILTSMSLPITWNVTATDMDSGEYGNVTYRKIVSSASNDAGMFVNLDGRSGQLTITKLPPPSSTPYQLTVEAVDGGNISSSISITIQIWTDFCQDNPCVNGGTCTNHLNSYTCECPEEYGGRNCSKLKYPCENLSSHPCLNGGGCSDTEDQLDYRCSCVDSYSGRNCAYRSVSFKPRSFQKYQLPGVSANSVHLHVSMQVAPKSSNGLLLYVGGDDYISMGLEDGRVVVRTPGKEITGSTPIVTTDGIWYLITMMKSGIELSINVSTWSSSNNVDVGSSDQLPDDQQMDDIVNTVFIGGLSADLTIPYEHTKSRDYIGCMRDLFVNGNRVQLTGETQYGTRSGSHNVEDGCILDSSQSCGTECKSEECIDFLDNSSPPYCDCTAPSANCTTAVPTAVGFTGQANLIVETLDDFFIATRQSRHTLQAREPGVKQSVSFRFRSTTMEAVLLSSAVHLQNSNDISLRVFWFDNNSLNYDVYQNDERCGHASVTGFFNDASWYNVQLTVMDTNTITLVVDDGNSPNTTTETDSTCPSYLFVELPSSTITITGRPAMHLSANLPDKDFQGCITDLNVDGVTVPLAKEYQSDLVMLQEEGSVSEVHNQCPVDMGGITGEEDEAPFLDLYIIVIIGVAVIIFLVVISVVVVWVIRRCLHHRPNKSRFDMSQEMPDVYQDSPPGTLTFRKKTDFDNASVGHYQEEGEEAMPDATAISIDSLRKSACNSSNSGTGSSAETGFHTGSERDHTSDAGYPEPTASMVNEETPSEVQESEYSTFVSDSDITSAVEQTLSPLDVQLLGPPNVLGIPPQARSMARKPSPNIKNTVLPPMERKISPFHSHSRFSMSTIESGSELSLGPPPPPDPILSYPHPSSIPHEPQLPGLKTLCGPDFNPISYWEQQSRLKPSIDPDYPLQRLSLASGRGTEDPSSTVSVASTLEEQHEFASQGGGEGEATNMRDGLESDHELDYRLADLHIPEYESMTLSQSTLVGGSEEYFPDATVKPCHPLVPVHDNSVSSNSPYNLPDYRHSPQSVSSSSTSYSKNSHQRLLSEQDLSTHNRYYERSRTGASRPSHMIGDHRLRAQYSNTSTSSASTPQTRRTWRSDDPINV